MKLVKIIFYHLLSEQPDLYFPDTVVILFVGESSFVA